MAIGTGVYRRLGAENRAAEEVAAEAKRQRDKESKLGGLMSILSPLAALGSKGIVHGLLGLGSGGILTPLLLGLGSAGLKGGTEKLARDAGMGADTGKVAKASTSKYGYGKESAEEIAELMQEGIDERSAFNPESLGTEIGLQYVSALTPKIGEAGKIQGTELGKNLMPGGEGKFSWFGDRRQTGLFGTGAKNVPSVLKNVKQLKGGFGGGKALKRMMASFMSDEKLKEKYGIVQDSIYQEGGLVSLGKGKSMLDLFQTDSGKYGAKQAFEVMRPEGKRWYLGEGESGAMGLARKKAMSDAMETAQFNPADSLVTGGLPIDEVLSALGGGEAMEEAPKKKKKFGFFEEGGQVPTIADFFDMQGKTLGGSNKKSLSEMLGRR